MKVDTKSNIEGGNTPVRARPGMYTDGDAGGIFLEEVNSFTDSNGTVEIRSSKAKVRFRPDGSSEFEFREFEDLSPIIFSAVYSKITASTKATATTATTANVTSNGNKLVAKK